MQSFLVIQNDRDEGAGQLENLIHQRKKSMHSYYGWEMDYRNHKVDDYSGLIVLGGVQAVYETEEHPYLLDEMSLVNSYIESNKPVIGLCLGAQIIAKALGGEVLPNAEKEIGWYETVLTEHAKHDDLMQQHPEVAMSFHFHGDVFTLPPGCVSLAKSSMTDCQLFRYKDNVYGFQYHAEVDMPLIEVMCSKNDEYMFENGYNAEEVINESKQELLAYQLRCSAILNKWIDKAEV